MKVQMICSDLDGTLLNSNGEISTKTIKTFRKAHQKHIKIVLASGRPYESLVHFSNEILQIPTYKISFNGAQINSINDDVIVEHVINNQIITDVIAMAERREISINLSTASKWINFAPRTIDSQIDKYNETLDDIRINSLSQFKLLCQEQSINILKIGMHIHDQQHLKSIYNELRQLKLNVVQADAEFLEATAAGISKYTALKQLNQQLGINLNQIVTFGDYENDFEMISKVPHGVAMSNGISKVKQAARYIAKSNDADGVADVVEALLNHQ